MVTQPARAYPATSRTKVPKGKRNETALECDLDCREVWLKNAVLGIPNRNAEFSFSVDLLRKLSTQDQVSFEEKATE